MDKKSDTLNPARTRQKNGSPEAAVRLSGESDQGICATTIFKSHNFSSGPTQTWSIGPGKNTFQ
ncbi:hypothetical protein J2Y86_000357 [Pseudomonas migulae]|uniref:hypothetical protein n=1 Tax=Pseudomonas migulae TaxID=78543 RepID=UPI00209E70DC|nr:hypothetical protein [Pseudomonas migulae]MCP1495650.1 hypothetical protein [Pseudomonas migulae]